MFNHVFLKNVSIAPPVEHHAKQKLNNPSKQPNEGDMYVGL